MRLVKNGDISIVSRRQLLERLHSPDQLFEDCVREEKRLPLGQRIGTTMVLAEEAGCFQYLRRWNVRKNNRYWLCAVFIDR